MNSCNDPIYKWEARSAKLTALNALGSIPVLCAGGLLQGNYLRVGVKVVAQPIRGDPGQRFDLTSCDVTKELNTVELKKLNCIKNASWKRISSSWSGFSQPVSLTLKNQNCLSTYEGLLSLKKWYVKQCCYSIDHGIKFLKTIQTLCLELCTGNRHARSKGYPSDYPGVSDGIPKHLLDSFFRGQLSWIAGRLRSYYSDNLTQFLSKPDLNQVTQLFQIAVGKRALAYPSNEGVRSSVEDSLNICRNSKNVDRHAVAAYGCGVQAITNKILAIPSDLRESDHISVSSSSRWEMTRGGGGSIALASLDFATINQWVTPDIILSLENRVDFLGRVVITQSMAAAIRLYESYDSMPFGLYPLAYFLYKEFGPLCGTDWIYIQIGEQIVAAQEARPPERLGDILLGMCGKSLHQIGFFLGAGQETCGLYHWEEVPMFIERGSIPMRISLSIESGLKTRLITAGPYCWSLLVQPARARAMHMLSKDKSLQLGFKEVYKTWEFLKSYRGVTPRFITSADLSDATYNMCFPLLQEHRYFYEKLLGTGPYGRLIQTFVAHRERRIVSSTNVEQMFDIKADFESKCGSHMGEGLSFIDLTIMNRTVGHIAACYRDMSLKEGYVTHFPYRYRQAMSYSESKIPHSQSAGDDHIALNMDDLYNKYYIEVMQGIGGVISVGKHGFSPYFGTFCEKAFFVWTLDDEKRTGIRAPDNCRFGSIVFLDVIKGRLINGLGKVSQKGDASFGQATALSTALRWWHGPKDLARLYFWVQNYDVMRRTSGMNLHLPPIFGGKDLPLKSGEEPTFDSLPEGKRSYLRYIQTISEMNPPGLFKWVTLLRSITFQPNKDISLSYEKLRRFSDLLADKVEDYKTIIGGSGIGSDFRLVNDYIVSQGYICINDVLAEIQRYESALHIVRNDYKPSSQYGISTRKMRDNFDVVWRQIKSSMEPTDWPENQTIQELALRVNKVCNTLYINSKAVSAVLNSVSMRVELSL